MVGLVGALVIGLVASMPPARWVGRHDVVEALTGAVTAEQRRSAAAPYVAPLLVALGVACGIWSLDVAEPVGAAITGADGPDGSFVLRVVATLGLTCAGVLASVPLLLRAAARLGRDAHVGVRLALGDAVRHLRRAWPAVAAVITCVLLATSLPSSVTRPWLTNGTSRGPSLHPGASSQGPACRCRAPSTARL